MMNSIKAVLRSTPLIILLSLFAGVAFAQSLPPGVSQTQIDAALQDLSELYGSPVVRVDQAKAICNEEQYMLECAKIGQTHGLFGKEREAQVKTVLTTFKESVVEKMKACDSAQCLVDVATTLARDMSAADPALARTLDLTTQKVEEKRVIIEAARSVGVDINECRTMDPDNASVELLRACAKLAKHDQIQKYIPEEDRINIGKTDQTIALKEALAKGELSCGDNTIEGCGTFCLAPMAQARNENPEEIPQVCRQIAERFFGSEGVLELERAHGSVKNTYKAVQEYQRSGDRYVLPQEEDDGSRPNLVCPTVQYPPCPQGEYRQEAVSELGCRVASACIPFNTKTQPKPIDKRLICPALPTVTSCPEGEEKVIAFTSPECGTYYSCRPVPKEDNPALKFPYKFASGRAVLTYDETRIYCHESGNGGATERGDKAECMQIFGIAVPEMPEYKKTCSSFGSDWKSVDQSGNCFNATMTEYMTAQGALKQCKETLVYGCTTTAKNTDTTKTESVTGSCSAQLMELLGSGCHSMGNAWFNSGMTMYVLPGGSIVKSCGSEHIFGCSGSTTEGDKPQCSDGKDNDGDGKTDYPSDTDCYGADDWNETYVSTTGGAQKTQIWNSYGLQSQVREDADPARIASLKQACANVKSSSGNVWMGSAGTYTSPDFGMPNPDKCAKAASCASGQYFDGVSCITSSDSGQTGTGTNTGQSGGGTSTMKNCFYPNATINGTPPGYTVWCEADYQNCRKGEPSGASVSLNGLALGTPSSCESGWSGGSTSGPNTTIGSECRSQSSQSACSAVSGCNWYTGYSGTYCDSGGSSSVTSCPSGQYWNGSSCVSSSSCSSSQYWDTRTNSCQNMQSACAEAGGTWDSAASYCTMPPGTSGSGSTSGSTSCGSGYYWNGSSCMPSSSSDSGSGSSCGSGMYWDGSACVSSGSSSGGTSAGTDYSSMQSGCTSAGGTWDSSTNYCQMPSSTSSGTTGSESTGGSTMTPQEGCAQAGGTWDSAASYCTMPPSAALNKSLAFLCPTGLEWNGGFCIVKERSFVESAVASVFFAVTSLFGF